MLKDVNSNKLRIRCSCDIEEKTFKTLARGSWKKTNRSIDNKSSNPLASGREKPKDLIY